MPKTAKRQNAVLLSDLVGADRAEVLTRSKQRAHRASKARKRAKAKFAQQVAREMARSRS